MNRHRKERMANDSYIHDAPAHIKEPGHISQISISFVTIVDGQIVLEDYLLFPGVTTEKCVCRYSRGETP